MLWIDGAVILVDVGLNSETRISHINFSHQLTNTIGSMHYVELAQRLIDILTIKKKSNRLFVVR